MSLFVFVLHVPFLEADPTVLIPYGRDAFTDEGLYASQVRNYIHHQNLTLYDSDALIKTPLYGFMQYLWYSIVGISQVKARLLTVVFVLVMLLAIASLHSNYKVLISILLAGILTMQPLFNYTHYSMAEMLSGVLILCSLLLFSEAVLQNKCRYAFASAILLSFSWGLKIQFLYILPAMVAAVVMLFLARLVKHKNLHKAGAKITFTYVATIMVFAVLFLLLWKMPHNQFFGYIMKEQTANRWVPYEELYDYIDKMYEYYFLNEIFKPSVYIFYAAILAGLVLAVVQHNNNRYLLILFFAVVWFVAELHKLKMYYLPVRYLVGLFLSGGFIIAIVVNELLVIKSHFKSLKILFRVTAVSALIYLLYYNSNNYIKQYHTRTFAMKEINEYFADYNFDNRPVIGAWAASLTWKSNALTLPVWNNYLDINRILEKHQPKVIITEADEADSGQAYTLNGINYEATADSILHKKIDNWNIKIIWLK